MTAVDVVGADGQCGVAKQCVCSVCGAANVNGNVRVDDETANPRQATRRDGYLFSPKCAEIH